MNNTPAPARHRKVKGALAPLEVTGMENNAQSTGFRTTTQHMLKTSKEYASQTLMGGLSGFESPIGLDRRDRIRALKTGDIGFVHSWDINTSVDGPGTRMTVFMSGCPLRCQYCQNPDTWKMRDGKPVFLDAMIKKEVERYADLFKATQGASRSRAANR